MDEWRPVKGYENKYIVSNNGDIKNKVTNKIIKPISNGAGNYIVNLYSYKKVKQFLISKIVAIAFIENPNNFKNVLHKDKNNLNNSSSNLEWIESYKNKIPWNKGLTKETDSRIPSIPCSQEKKDKLSITHKNKPEEYKKAHFKKMTEARLAMDVYCRTGQKHKESSKELISIAHIGMHHKPESKAKMSISKTQMIMEGKLPQFDIGTFFSTKNNKKFIYRSSYELKAFDILENNNNVYSYDYECIQIKYLDISNNYRATIPDFFVTYTDGVKEIIEVKSSYYLKNAEQQIKIKAMQNYSKENNLKFDLWTEEELFNHENSN